MPALVLLSPPAEEPLSLEAAKLHLRVDDDTDNDLINSLIKAARLYCENYTSRQYVTATWAYHLDCFPSDGEGAILLPRPPLQSVSSITYIDAEGSLRTFDPSDYVVDAKSEPARIKPAYGQSWPDVRETLVPITVNFVAGYGAAAAVPEAVKTAMRLLIGHWYENRQAVITGTISTALQFTIDSLLSQYWYGEYV